LLLNAAHGIVTLRVMDTGPGIEAAELPLIFDRFFRGAQANGEGSGLGLSLSREIARLHRGQISASNRVSGGSDFVVTLPLAPTSPRTLSGEPESPASTTAKA
jgi:signal transduction histidine kinase